MTAACQPWGPFVSVRPWQHYQHASRWNVLQDCLRPLRQPANPRYVWRPRYVIRTLRGRNDVLTIACGLDVHVVTTSMTSRTAQ